MASERFGEWIAVSDRLPAESEPIMRNPVLAWFNWGRGDFSPVQFAEISCGHWRPMTGNGNFDQYVTHWMPLPEPPK